MKRREFSAASLAGWAATGLTAAGLPQIAAAQGQPQPGKDYVVLSQRQPVAAPAGKIEVVEFFWYGCPHCYRFDPTLEAWLKKIPADVAFRRVHVAFAPPYQPHQKLFYALEAMGREPEVHAKVFNAIHQERLPLNTPEAIADFLAKFGFEKSKFLEVYNSFGVATKCQQASKLGEGYKIDGVPTLGVHGRFWTSGSLTSNMERALAVTDHLIGLARKG